MTTQFTSSQDIQRSLFERQRQRDAALSPHAVRCADSRGREKPEPLDWAQNPYQLDRDRIVATKAFRRMMHKTQVFIAPSGDHYLTRLTHTMEVSRISRAVSRALNLNEDLVEAICMAHDLGHAPFGHLGEATLAEVYPGGFRHNRQSVRVVEVLANDGQGLNLTWEVRQGILRHSKARSGIEGRANPELDTLEGLVAKLGDALAYVNHDTADAIRAGIITDDDLPEEVRAVLSADRSAWVPNMVSDIVESSWAAAGEGDQKQGEWPEIRMSDAMSGAANALREFLFLRVYEPASADAQADRAREIIRLLYEYFLKRSDRIPEEYRIRGESPDRMALDYVSGMTDGYALRVAETIRPGVTEGFQESGVSLSLPPVHGWHGPDTQSTTATGTG